MAVTSPILDVRAPAEADLRIRLMGVPVAVASEQTAAEALLDAADAGRGHWTITANLDHLRRYRSEPVARELMDEADLIVADGMPLVWASRVAGTPLPERVAGSRLVWSICREASARGHSIFLLGGNDGVAEDAADIFTARYPELEIAGTMCPQRGFMRSELELGRIGRRVEQADPSIVFVALGFPTQDLLIRILRERLPNVVFVGVGISLSYATGDASQAPEWICNMGMEWAYRLSQEPSRLVRRYLVDGMPFAIRMMSSAAWCRVRPRAAPGLPLWGGIVDGTVASPTAH
jgi:N-acetylglucosaminyldiphosphoundecaprenol N-acetyl-beta-D-mannosaminyltransferase